MPSNSWSCDPAARGLPYNAVTVENGPILFDCHFGWDGVSVMPNCDGPISFLRVRNTGNVVWYANLPNKKNGSRWIAIDPGTDITLNAGQRNQAGLNNYSDVQGVGLAATPGG